VRQFDTGATRDSDDGKYDYEGFLSPIALERYGAFMHANRIQADGSRRDSDNWQKGIPTEQYLKSLIRHVFGLWTIRRGHPYSNEKGQYVDVQDELCAIMFNAMGLLHELIKVEREEYRMTWRQRTERPSDFAAKINTDSKRPDEPLGYMIPEPGYSMKVPGLNNGEDE
jgi:hypothetical protein